MVGTDQASGWIADKLKVHEAASRPPFTSISGQQAVTDDVPVGDHVSTIYYALSNVPVDPADTVGNWSAARPRSGSMGALVYRPLIAAQEDFQRCRRATK